jgi:hypothetical protein
MPRKEQPVCVLLVELRHGQQDASHQSIHRRANASGAPVEHVRVDHCRAHVGVAEQLLNRPDIVAVFEEMRRERMPERVARGAFRDPRRPHGVADSALEHRLVQEQSREGLVLVEALTCPSTAGADRKRDTSPAPISAGCRLP